MIFRIVKSVIMALYIGSMFFNAPPHHFQSDLRSIQGLVFNVIAFIAFAALASMPQTLMERQVFYLQRTNRYYSTFPYFVAGICVELPVSACESIIYGRYQSRDRGVDNLKRDRERETDRQTDREQNRGNEDNF
jgi:ABC-2 type transporter